MNKQIKRTHIKVEIDMYIPMPHEQAEGLVKEWLDQLRSQFIGMNGKAVKPGRQFKLDERYKIIGEEVIHNEDKYKPN